MKKIVKIVTVVVALLVILTVGVAQAEWSDWGPPTGYPTIDAWRRAGRQNDRERYSNGGNRYYSPDAWRRAGRQNDRERWERYYNYSDNGYRNGGYSYGYPSQSGSITIGIGSSKGGFVLSIPIGW